MNKYTLHKKVKVTKEEYIKNRKDLIRIYKEDLEKAEKSFLKKKSKLELKILELESEISELELSLRWLW